MRRKVGETREIVKANGEMSGSGSEMDNEDDGSESEGED